MKTLPRILKIVSIEPFKITTLWNTGEIRINDLSVLLTDPNSNLIVLHDASVFMQAAVSAERTLCWPSVLLSIPLATRTITAPLDLDPDTLYSQSTLVRKVERIPIGTMLKEARQAAGLSQIQMAANSGTTRNYISRIENNKSDIQLETLHKIVELGLGKTMIVQIR